MIFCVHLLPACRASFLIHTFMYMYLERFYFLFNFFLWSPWNLTFRYNLLVFPLNIVVSYVFWEYCKLSGKTVFEIVFYDSS